MNTMKKVISLLLSISIFASLIACSSAGTQSSSSQKESVSSSVSVSSSESSEEVEEIVEEETSEEEVEESADTTPRNETLYINGVQWGKANSVNPFSTDANFFIMTQNNCSDMLFYEPLYMYNTLDGKLYPLLADGEAVWNSDRTELTIKVKSAAKWSDGTAVTAHDVAATFDAHVKYQSLTGVDYGQYISAVEATDDSTVVFKTVADNYNPLKIEEYLPKIYVLQKAYLESIDEKTGGNSEQVKTESMWDAPHSGPYDIYVNTDQKVGVMRNENYWGQDASMWGSLPAPKYIIHNIYADNAAGDAALRAGEIDISNQFISNVQKMWENDGLEISTYYTEAPYHIPASMPSAWFNCQKEGLDQKSVRQAIAYAVDYDQIISAAMSNQSPTFTQAPRSIFNPSAVEQQIYSRIESDISEYQWVGKEYERANKVLDDAGIVDTDGDGIREYNGKNLEFTVECPKGWSDWNAALDLVADAGQYIGIKLETYYPEKTVWTEDLQTGNFDIIMQTTSGFSISNPWTRAYQTMYGYGGEFPERTSLGYSRFYSEEVDAALKAIPLTTDEAELDEYYKTINKVYLDEVPSFALMYRGEYFHTVYEGVWTGFPEDGDGTNIPPTICINGYGVAALYNITNIE